uniref:Uncharacterized protein n=1 Tax=Tanacetum cinerariifolium TaxID=118510 RepID=A0A699L7H2_TANCI|nr:hypothetical protein [Tanacetum cinerariifolium]
MEQLPETRYVDPTGASSHTARTGSAATERAKVEHYIRLLHEPLRREEALALLNKHKILSVSYAFEFIGEHVLHTLLIFSVITNWASSVSHER